MKSNTRSILAINSGSSSIKFALFGEEQPSTQVFAGRIEGIGTAGARFSVKGLKASDSFPQHVAAPDYSSAIAVLLEWLSENVDCGTLTAVGHRVVHGGPEYWRAQRLTAKVIADLHQYVAFDPTHLPEALLLVEAFQRRFPKLPQVACFDTAFHHYLPRVAQILPIPRRYEAKGIRRYGFHGLSYAYLMLELQRVAGAKMANGRVILAHLGNGASITAVRDGHSVDTTMGFTPAAGLPMSTRSGDLDPGLVSFFASSEQMSPAQFDHMANHESGLLGISETSSDLRELMAQESSDVRAAEAVAVFCYQAKKWLGAYAAALGGIDTLVFAGGIGENQPQVRERICDGLGFLGIELDAERNAANANLISTGTSRVAVRVIRTDEEIMIARSVRQVLSSGSGAVDDAVNKPEPI